jgi:RND family efflux transporter MFP subunit
MRKVAELALLIVVVAGLPACRKKGGAAAELPPAQGQGAAPMPALPSVAAPEQTTMVAPTEGRTTGTTFPRAEAQIAAKAGGVINQIFVKEGDKVRRGQTLFRQDTQDAALRVQQAAAGLEAAKVQLRAVETEYTRTKSMYDQKAVNGMQWDQVVARLDGAKVGVQQAEVALDMARKAQADATVRSPIDGVVTAKLKSEGEMATMMPPTIVLVIQDQSVLELRFRLPERALTEVKIGETVTAKIDALGVTRPAKVTRIQSAVDARTRTIEVVAELPNPDGLLKTGLLAEVELPGATAAAATPPPLDGPRAGRPAPKAESKTR